MTEPSRSQPTPRVLLVATVRDEGPFLLEWIAYHRLIGFTDLILCSNDCADDSPALLDRLAARGLIRHLRCTPPPGAAAQLFAYQAAERAIAGAWPEAVMVLDADEFLLVHVGDHSVGALLAAVPEATSIAINWRIFGSGGARAFAPEPVTSRFRRAAPRDHGVNWSFKTLCRTPDAYHCPLLPHGPGHAKQARAPALRAVDGAGRPLPPAFARAEAFLQSAPGTVRWDLAQVNHYNTRAWEDYCVKHWRGGGLGPERWDRAANWAIFDRNEEADEALLAYHPDLPDAMAALRADPETRAAEARCVAAYRAHIARLAEAEAA
ncbi:glycosyltransferase family 2 protein [Sphingomonas morindae]|uniref:Glycosyltransferase family 2 protein n=1 Tax=Sphingomonas morindae TaxID=1541170 RepID=A0ABY4X7N3_9SPHN|nr:glycosyltransferase family 2 protein [Sphingomonas morindae]USI72910.1 glycosyltransferase family 2 protein [Sphingomonas morindae]